MSKKEIKKESKPLTLPYLIILRVRGSHSPLRTRQEPRRRRLNNASATSANLFVVLFLCYVVPVYILVRLGLYFWICFCLSVSLSFSLGLSVYTISFV